MKLYMVIFWIVVGAFASNILWYLVSQGPDRDAEVKECKSGTIDKLIKPVIIQASTTHPRRGDHEQTTLQGTLPI